MSLENRHHLKKIKIKIIIIFKNEQIIKFDFNEFEQKFEKL